jgi:trehalose 6-phosphate phosphatase
MRYLFGHLDEVKARISESKRTYLLLDCDGTLAPIVREPQQAVVGKRMSRALWSLAKMPSCVLAIVSGRSLEDVRRLVGIDGIYYVGNHGLEISGPHIIHTDRTAQNFRRSIGDIAQTLRRLESVGVTVEDKQLTLTVHYRRAALRSVPVIKSAVESVMRVYPHFEVTAGKKVLEIRPRTEWNKGLAVQWLINQLGSGLPIYVGDDLTDEDAFSRVRGGVTILVSGRWKATNAKYYLKDATDVYKFLRLLATWIQLHAGIRNTLRQV